MISKGPHSLNSVVDNDRQTGLGNGSAQIIGKYNSNQCKRDAFTVLNSKNFSLDPPKLGNGLSYKMESQ